LQITESSQWPEDIEQADARQFQMIAGTIYNFMYSFYHGEKYDEQMQKL